jgi:ribulose-phosphate 3-epimerase
MGVEPGFGGQVFIKKTIHKIKELKAIIVERELKVKIYVDGGINDVTAKEVEEAGADVVVAGSYLFNAKDMKKALGAIING